ncbi:MAG TPA: PAS domain S-box protein, partial [Spirochaetota bacterium]|nr:PAS domain S-box protein [Spirochaetota bacterium]
MDVDLGDGMDGTATAREILARHEVPVLFLSSHTEKEIVRRTEEISSYGYVVKNSGDVVLLASIKMALRLHAANRKLEHQSEELEAANEELNATIEELEQANEELQRSESDLMERERVLHESELLLDHTGEMARVGGWQLVPATLEVTWTRETYRIHEVPIGQRPSLEEAINFFHPDDRGRLSEAIARAIEHGEPYDMEMRFITAKGNRLWTRTRCIPEVEHGKTVLLRGIFQDITERKQNELAMRESEEHYRAIVENTSDFIMRYDREGRHLFGNRAALEVTGVTLDEYVGKTHREMGFPEDLCALWEEGIHAVFETAEPRAVNFDVALPGGTMSLELKLFPEFGADGSVASVIGVSRDMSEHVRTADALHERIKELDCLYGVADIIESPGAALEDVLRGIAALIPPALSRPEAYGARIVAGERDYASPGFTARTPLCAIDITEHGAPYGTIEVHGDAAHPLLPEETRLIEAVAERTSRMIERTIAEGRLRESDELIRALRDSRLTLMYTHDLEGNFTDADDGLLELLGYRREEIRSINFASLIGDEQLEKALRILQDLISTGRQSAPAEYLLHARDGREITIETIGFPIYRNGRLSAIIGIARDITEQKSMEEKLRSSEAKFRSLFENITIGVAIHEIVVDDNNNPIDFTWLDCNPAYENMTRLHRSEIVGKRGLDIIPSLEHTWISTYGRVALSGEPVMITDHSEYLDRYWEVYAFSPKLGFFAVAMKDITEHKRMEEELRASTDRLVRAEFASHSGNWEFHLATGSVFASEGARAVYGLWNENWTISEVQKVPLPEYRALLDEAMGSLMDGTRPYDVEFRIRRPSDGEVRDIHSIAEYDRERNVVFGVIRDVTEQKRAERAAAANEERYRMLFEHDLTGDFVFDVTRERIVDCNDAFVALLGFTDRAAVQNGAEGFHALDLPELRASFDALRTSRFISHHEVRMHRRDGAEVHLDQNLVGIFDQAGTLSLVLGYFYDITARKHYEAKLRQSLEDKNMLMRELQHRVKNNLNLVSALLGLEMGNLVDQGARNIFSNMQNRIASMAKLYEQLHGADSTERVSMKEYVASVSLSLSSALTGGMRGIRIRATADDIVLDMRQAVPLGIIMNELATNAIKHAYPWDAPGEIRITLTREDGHAALTVADDGRGLPPGFSIEDAKSMGMQLVGILARQIRGTVTVESGPGTTVRVLFPLPHPLR